VQSTQEKPQGPLEIKVYPGASCAGSAYFDDGHTFKYKKGEFSRISMSCQQKGDVAEVNISAPQGSFKPWFDRFAVQYFALSKKPRKIWLNGKEVSSWNFDSKAQRVRLETDYTGQVLQLKIEL
jgi:alpha-glucosidase